MLKVYGHPRSGNYYLMTLLALNYYANEDVSIGEGFVGHWADRTWVPGSEYGKLAGHHGPPRRGFDPANAIYIYRDGRAVIASLYRSQHFMNPEWEEMDFSQFIRTPLDWVFSPGRQSYPECNVIEHWHNHLKMWQDEHIHKAQYERAVYDAKAVLDSIADKFGLPTREVYELPDRLVGWYPSGGKVIDWQSLWNEKDTDYFFDIVGDDFWGVEKELR